MKKPRIRVGEALADIRTGMDDQALMEKYGLSPKGLESLLKKLGRRGRLKNIEAQEVVEDLRSGMTDQELMAKYKLSPEGLQSMFEQMDRFNLLKPAGHQDVISDKIVIGKRQIVKAIESGISRSELMRKYGLTSRGLSWILKMLLISGDVSWKEIQGKIASSSDELSPDKPSKAKRYELDFYVGVHDESKPEIQGRLCDVSKNGVRVRGIRCEVGQSKTPVISSDEFGEFAIFRCDATCRWVKRDSRGDHVTGFEISNISVENMSEFQWFMRQVQISEPS